MFEAKKRGDEVYTNDLPTNQIPTEEFSGGVNLPGYVGNDSGAECFPVPDNEAPPQKKPNKLRGLLASFAAITVLGVSVALPGVGASGADAQILDVTTTPTSIECSVDVGDGDYFVVISNNFTERILELDVGVNTKKAEGLQPGMEYTVSIKAASAIGKGKTLTKRTVYTPLE